MVCLSRPYPFKYFNGCLPQILFGLFLNTLSQMKHNSHTKHILQHILKLQPPKDGKCCGITHSLKKTYSLETCARLLFMLLQDFFASTRPHRVDKGFFLPKSAGHYLYHLKSNNIIVQKKTTNTEKLFYP